MQFINRNSELTNNEFDGAIELQDLTGQSSLINNNPVEPFYYDATGNFRKRRAAKRAEKNKRKNAKVAVKQTQAKAQLQAAKSVGKSDPVLAAALAQPTPAPVEEKSNTALYVGLGVAGLALVGAVIYFVAKKKK